MMGAPDNPHNEAVRPSQDGQRRILDRLLQLSRQTLHIASLRDFSSVLQAVVDAATDLAGARYGALAVFDRTGRVQTFLTHGMTEAEHAAISRWPEGQGLLKWLQELDGPVRLSDLSRHPRSVGFPLNHPRMKSFLGVPVRYLGESLGNLYLTDKQGAEEFAAEDEDLLVLFSSQVAVLVHNARLQERAEEHLRRMEQASSEMDLLHAMTRLAVSTLHLEQVLERALPLVLQATGADLVEVWLVNPLSRALDLHSQHGAEGTPVPAGRSLLVGQGLPGLAARLLRPAVSTDLPHEPLLHRKELVDLGYLGYCAYPMVFQGECLGVLGVALREPERLPDGFVHLGERFADELAVALRNAQLYAQVEDLARDRGRLLEQAERQRERLEALLDSAPVGVLEVEAETVHVVLVNQEMQRLTRIPYQSGERLDRYETALAYQRPDGRAYASSELPLQRALATGEHVVAEEVRFRYPDGTSVPTLVDAVPLYGKDGKIVAAFAVVQDLTPLEEIDRLRNEFLGMVSHELKTPLTAIKGAAATVLGSPVPLRSGETRSLFGIINEEADRLRDMVDNLLDMSRIEAGAFSIHPEPTDLRSVLEEAVAVFPRGVKTHPVSLRLPGGLPGVSVDRRRIAQVVNNLLSNAVKFSPPGSQIVVDAETAGDQVVVHVRDQGRGIPADKLPHLFKKFSQVHEESGHKLAGSGLGLAICKGIVEAHGGRISVESPGEGRGAVFSFTLPSTQAPAPEESPLSDRPLELGPHPVDLTRRANLLGRVRRAGEKTRVLVVDDEVNIVRYLKRLLTQAGYEVVATTDPVAVPGMVEEQTPDLVLLDLRMPGMSGFQVLERIREISGLPVIFLTSSTSDQDAVKALQMGADDYMNKPFSPQELLARVEVALRRRSAPDLLEARPPFVLGDLVINFAERSVSVGGQHVDLSATEYKILYELAANAGRVLTHDQLLQRVWGPEYLGETGLLRSFVYNLRRKLGDDRRQPRYVLTEQRIGYRMPKPGA